MVFYVVVVDHVLHGFDLVVVGGGIVGGGGTNVVVVALTGNPQLMTAVGLWDVLLVVVVVFGSSLVVGSVVDAAADIFLPPHSHNLAHNIGFGCYDKQWKPENIHHLVDSAVVVNTIVVIDNVVEVEMVGVMVVDIFDHILVFLPLVARMALVVVQKAFAS